MTRCDGWKVGAGFWGVAVAVVVGSQGCAPAAQSGAPVAAAASPYRDAETPATSSGTLRQEQISVRMIAGDLRIELTPLAEWVLEAAAPDTRDRLARIGETHGSDLARRSGEGTPVLFLVTFSSMRPGAEFHPDDLHLLSRGLRERPAAIQAITPGWGSRRLEQQQSAVAVYAYPESVDLSRELTVWYRDQEDSSWSAIVARVEAERGRIPDDVVGR